MGQLLKEAADECPDRVGLIDGSPDPEARRSMTYGEMYADSLAVARALRERFDVGERVAVMSPNSLEWVLLEFGSALAGTILVTVNPSFQAEEVAYVLKQSGSAGMIVKPEFRGNHMLKSVEQVRDECPNLREVIRFDEWDAFVDSGRRSTIELPDVQPGDATMIQYTSGTTGFPKGALLHHRGLVNNGDHMMQQMGVGEGVMMMTIVPLFHTAGCVLSVLGAVSRKATQIVVEMFEPGLILELAEAYEVKALCGVPTMLVAMRDHPTFETRRLNSIQSVASGGSTVPAALVERFETALGAKFSIIFGQTECSPVASMTLPDDSSEDKLRTLGCPMPNVEVKIVDPETNETLPVNSLGEFCTRGYHVMHGYFEMDEATAQAIDEDGWLHTGDLCSMDERGYCSIEGRLKDMIIRGGENIYPREIEECLFRHPAVADVAVVGVPDERFGEIVAAFLRPAAGCDIDHKALFAYLREHLSPQKTPALWFAMDAFPMTGSGKIQKMELRKLWERGEVQPL